MAMNNLVTGTTIASASSLNDRRRQPFAAIRGQLQNDYESRVMEAYQDDPVNWSKAIGDRLWFQFGVYDDPQSPRPADLDESGLRYFERQLKIAGLDTPGRQSINRILDIGCGWGTVLRDLSERFPGCHRLDGINISDRQLEYCAEVNAARSVSDRINLFRCNALDIDLLPDFDVPYDLAIMRGVISHFPYDLFEIVMAKLRRRLAANGTVIVSITYITSTSPNTVPIRPTWSTGSRASIARRPHTCARCSSKAASASTTCRSCRTGRTRRDGCWTFRTTSSAISRRARSARWKNSA